MSLNANFEDWCRRYRLKPAKAVYLQEGLGGLHEGEARIIRMTHWRKRAGERVPQKYVIETCVEDELYYPFGTNGMTREQLLRKMISATMGRIA